MIKRLANWFESMLWCSTNPAYLLYREGRAARLYARLIPVTSRLHRLDLLKQAAEEYEQRHTADPYVVSCQFAWAAMYASAIQREDVAQELYRHGMQIYSAWVSSAPATAGAA